MKRIKTADRHSIRGRLRNLVLILAIPLCVLSLFIFLVFLVYNMQYAKVSSNITTASGFNQNFKDEVDLRMYSFVIGSNEVLPWEEVDTAKQLAKTLLESTTNKESRSAIKHVLNLCENLNNCMTEIRATKGYEERFQSLETNVYIITSLIQKYMYTYLFHEAGELARLRESLNKWLITELVVVIAVMAVTLIFSLKKSLRLTKSISTPIDQLYNRVELIGQGDLSARPPVEAEDVQLQTLSRGLEQMVERLKDQMELYRQEQIKLQGTELALLQAQINPHFLYNTLDAIIWLIETGKDHQAEEMISNLSTYFRSFLSNGKDIVSLREEEMHVRSYLKIQQVRYKDILNYEIDMDPALADSSLPKMTLQPLVENAIYHGIKPKRGISKVSITSRLEEGCVVIRVSDTGAGMDPEKLTEVLNSLERDDAVGFGLVAVYKRLRLMYGEAFSFCVDSAPDEGTTIRISFPFRNEMELIA